MGLTIFSPKSKGTHFFPHGVGQEPHVVALMDEQGTG